MPLADGRAGAHQGRRAQRDRRPLRRGQGSDRRLRDLRVPRQGGGAGLGGRVHAAAPASTCRAGKAPARSARWPDRKTRVPAAGRRARRTPDARTRSIQPAAMTAADVDRAIGHPGGLADRAAAADHQPGADAARRAAGGGPDAGSPAGGAGALAGDRRAGKARRLADGNRQTPGAGSSAPRPDARAQARRWSRSISSRSSRPCPTSTARSTTTSATNCCG